MTGAIPATARALLSVAALSLTLGVLAAGLAPGYREPQRWDLPPLRPVPAGHEAPLEDVAERSVRLTVRGMQVPAVLLTPPHPQAALVVVHGSGPGDPGDAKRRAVALASHGVAVLVPEKVLAGYSVFRRDFVRLGDDAMDAARWLGAELRLDARDVGLLGLSEGGWVSLLAAARHHDQLGPIVLDSAPVVTPLEQAAYVVSGGGAPAPLGRLLTGLLASGRPLLSYLDADVRSALPRVDNRVIAVFGAADSTVPVAQAADRLRRGLPVAPTVIVSPGGHLPPADLWATVVARELLAPGPRGSAWSIDGARLPDGAAGAPTPPAPSPALDPRWHLAVAGLLLLGLRLVRSHPSRPEESSS